MSGCKYVPIKSRSKDQHVSNVAIDWNIRCWTKNIVALNLNKLRNELVTPAMVIKLEENIQTLETSKVRKSNVSCSAANLKTSRNNKG